MQYPKQIKIILLGDPGCGKKSLAKEFVFDDYKHKYPIELDYITKKISVNENETDVKIYVYTGTERFCDISDTCFRGNDACILVYDVNNAKSFENLEQWKKEFRIHDEKSPIFLVGTKIDKEMRAVIHKRAIKWCKDNGIICYTETSSAHDINITNLFMTVINHVVKLKTGKDMEFLINEPIVENEITTNNMKPKKEFIYDFVKYFSFGFISFGLLSFLFGRINISIKIC